MLFDDGANGARGRDDRFVDNATGNGQIVGCTR
jgi:hypothetical protein